MEKKETVTFALLITTVPETLSNNTFAQTGRPVPLVNLIAIKWKRKKRISLKKEACLDVVVTLDTIAQAQQTLNVLMDITVLQAVDQPAQPAKSVW